MDCSVTKGDSPWSAYNFVSPTACLWPRITIPASFSVKRATEVRRAIVSELGSEISDSIDFKFEVARDKCIVTLPINPHAEKDAAYRMLILQWMTKRLAEFCPPIDLSNLKEMQRTLH